jgi:hypothetical protein
VSRQAAPRGADSTRDGLRALVGVDEHRRDDPRCRRSRPAAHPDGGRPRRRPDALAEARAARAPRAARAVLSSAIGTRIIFAEGRLENFELSYSALFVLALVIFTAPLLVFTPKLLQLKRKGSLD